MKFSSPIYIILTGSLFLGGLIFIFLLILQSSDWINLSRLFLVLIPIFTTVLSFFIFTYFISRFINNKIKFVYGIITNQKLSDEMQYSISENILTKLTKDAEEWATVQKQQIVELQNQAAFRKEFLGNLAHELKTPVFSIQGYVLTLLEGGLEDDTVNRDFLLRALNGVDRISNLLEDLDAIAKFETDRFELTMQKFNIIDLVKNVFDELESEAKRKKITLKFDQEYDPFFVNADKNKITQALVNLVSNSISYGVENGETRIIISNLDRKKIIIEVSDNGVGMAEEHFPRLFERFYRVEKSRERNLGGSGLGLAIVKHIIEAHKQIINVNSTEGLGSTFSFTLEKS